MIRNPSEVIKTNLQIGKIKGSTYNAVSEIYAKSGISGFYVGYLSLIMREIPFSSIQYPFYEFLKGMAISFESNRNNISKDKVILGGIQLALIGSVAGSFSGFIVTPLDVLKTR